MRTDRTRQARLGTRPLPEPVPLIWENPTALGLAVVLLIVFTPLVVQAGLSLVITGAAAWPDPTLAGLVGLATGSFGHGLPAQVAGRLPGDAVMWAATVAAELAVLSGLLAASVGLRRRLHAGSRAGLSTPAQADRALGAGALRRQAGVIRPDLLSPRTPWSTMSLAGLRPQSRRRDPATAPVATARGRAGTSGPSAIGWRLGSAGRHGPGLWVPYDRTTCVIGRQGSGKTLDLLMPALLGAPGAALVTLTKPEDLFLSLEARQDNQAGQEGQEGPALHDRGRPVAVLDPFDLAPGVPELVWDPIAGCEEAMVAERRAKAFAAGTTSGATTHTGDQAARFYAGECAKVLQGYFHAAALEGLTLGEVMAWVANPRGQPQPEEILRTHPRAAPRWDGLLRGALHGDERTAANTVTTLQQALALFFQPSILARCVPSLARPATDLDDLISRRGTVYLLGREDPYASASPLMTAVTEHILDTAKHLGETSPHGRLCPPFLACLDELPSTAPIPSLATRMANERALGVSFLLAAQTWRQLVAAFGTDQARTILGLSNNLIVFGGGKDAAFYQEICDLIGDITTLRHSHSRADQRTTRSYSPAETPILRPAELRRLPPRQALLLAETHDPILVHLRRCIEGRAGARLLQAQSRARDHARARARVQRRDPAPPAPSVAPSQAPAARSVDGVGWGARIAATARRLRLPDLPPNHGGTGE